MSQKRLNTISELADIFDIDEFISLTNINTLTPEDGVGYFVYQLEDGSLMQDEASNCFEHIPEDAVHIAWYNK